MKKLLLLPFLMLGFSFSCDLPNESVGGIQLGCPYEPALKSSSISANDGRVKVFEESLQGSFFEVVRIKTLDGNIEEVSFRKNYQDVLEMNKGLEPLLSNLKSRWGEYKEINIDGRTRIYIIKSPKSEILDSVFTTLLFKNSLGVVSAASFVEVSVTYFSKKINDYSEELAAQEDKKLAEQLEGF